MKKLMIAAAAAAMIGGAYAAEYVYDVSASLKTTVGAQGKGATLKYNLGKSATDYFWYEDSIFTDSTNLTWDVDGNTTVFPGVLAKENGKSQKMIFTDAFYKIDAKIQAEVLAYLGTTSSKDDYSALYGLKSAKKWCATVKVVIPGTCYRKAGSYKFSGYGVTDDCCENADGTDFGLEIYVGNSKVGPVYKLGEMETVLFNLFGSDVAEKATKIEYAATYGDVSSYGDEDIFAVAGQGSWGKIGTDSYKDAVYGVSSISGNIVGALEAPTCENCCEDDTDAVAFFCDGGDATDEPTAAYGTFTIKFNKKFSTFD